MGTLQPGRETNSRRGRDPFPDSGVLPAVGVHQTTKVIILAMIRVFHSGFRLSYWASGDDRRKFPAVRLAAVIARNRSCTLDAGLYFCREAWMPKAAIL